MSSLWMRKCRIVVTDASGFGMDFSKFHCKFKIEKSLTETPNYSEVVIYNLSANTENTIIDTGQKIIVEAGYENTQYGLIFNGDIIQPLREREDGTTYKLTLISQDGDIFFNNSFVCQTYSAGQTLGDIDAQIVSSAGNAEVGKFTDELNQTTLARAKVVFGSPSNYLRKSAHTKDAAFYVNDGKTYITKASDVPDGQVIDLSPASGLIGVPEQTESGIKGKCLLNPNININTLVHVDNSLVRQYKVSLTNSAIRQLDNDGMYRILTVVHTGDTRNDEWYTEFTAVNQSGSIPETGSSMY